MKPNSRQGKKPPPKTPATAAAVDDHPPRGAGALPWWIFAAAVLVAILIYAPALRGPLIFDDLELDPLTDGGARGLQSYLGSVRPLFYTSLYLERQIAGSSTWLHHSTNLLLHLVNTWLLFGILKRITALADLEERLRTSLPLFGAALFLLHPINTEAVAYISSRSEVLSVLFGFSAFALFLRNRKQNVTIPQTLLIVVLIALGARTKEHIVAIVPLMILTDLFFGGFTALKRNARLHLPVVVLGCAGALYILTTLTRVSNSAGFGAGLSPVNYFATQCRAIWHYVRLFVAPWPQNLDHGYPLSESLFDPLALAGLAALIASVAAAFVKRKSAPLAAFGWLAFLVLLAPTSSFVPIADTLVERRMYLPMIGLLLIVIQVLSRVAVPKAALTAVLALLAIATFHRNGAYADPVRMWQDSVAANESNPRARFQLGQLLYLKGACQEAEPHLARAYELGMKTTPLVVNWALALDCLGRADDAVKTLQLAVSQNGAHFVYANLAMIEGKRGNYTAALAAADRSIKLNPRFDMAWFYRGNILLATGQKPEAAEAYRRALAINPRNADAQRMLAAAMAP